MANNENIVLDYFLNGMELFLNNRKKSDNLPCVTKQGLELFFRIPSIDHASLFLLNESNFEFEFATCLPDVDRKQIAATFQDLIEYGVIGETLQCTNLSSFVPKAYDQNDIVYFVIPLIVVNNALGLVVLRSTDLSYKTDPTFLKIINIIAVNFAFTLEIDLLTKNLKKTQALLEQKVAARTMNLAQSKRELQAILDSVQAGILIIDNVTDSIVNVNPIAAYILGETIEKISGRNAREFFPIFELTDHHPDERLKYSRNFESSIRKTDGDEVPILRTISNISLGDQKFRVESFFDITERKLAEIALKQANELLELKVEERTEDLQILIHKLQDEIYERKRAEEEIRKMLEKEQELNELKTRFISMVSHEFRTPLTVISSSAQMLQNYSTQLSAIEQGDYLSRIIKTVENMRDLLDNVLFLGRADSQLMQFSPKNVNLSKLCRDIVEEIHLSASQKREIDFKIEHCESYVVLDETLVRHILYNLLSNAIKYSKDDRKVIFRLNNDCEKTDFVVQDFGIGIPEEEQNKIFEAFHRARNVGTISGTGIGMTIVLRSLELLGGRIEFTSRLNVGTTFKVTIPTIKL